MPFGRLLRRLVTHLDPLSWYDSFHPHQIYRDLSRSLHHLSSELYLYLFTYCPHLLGLLFFHCPAALYKQDSWVPAFAQRNYEINSELAALQLLADGMGREPPLYISQVHPSEHFYEVQCAPLYESFWNAVCAGVLFYTNFGRAAVAALLEVDATKFAKEATRRAEAAQARASQKAESGSQSTVTTGAEAAPEKSVSVSNPEKPLVDQSASSQSVTKPTGPDSRAVTVTKVTKAAWASSPFAYHAIPGLWVSGSLRLHLREKLGEVLDKIASNSSGVPEGEMIVYTLFSEVVFNHRNNRYSQRLVLWRLSKVLLKGLNERLQHIGFSRMDPGITLFSSPFTMLHTMLWTGGLRPWVGGLWTLFKDLSAGVLMSTFADPKRPPLDPPCRKCNSDSSRSESSLTQALSDRLDQIWQDSWRKCAEVWSVLYIRFANVGTWRGSYFDLLEKQTAIDLLEWFWIMGLKPIFNFSAYYLFGLFSNPGIRAILWYLGLSTLGWALLYKTIVPKDVHHKSDFAYLVLWLPIPFFLLFYAVLVSWHGVYRLEDQELGNDSRFHIRWGRASEPAQICMAAYVGVQVLSCLLIIYAGEVGSQLPIFLHHVVTSVIIGAALVFDRPGAYWACLDLLCETSTIFMNLLCFYKIEGEPVAVSVDSGADSASGSSTKLTSKSLRDLSLKKQNGEEPTTPVKTGNVEDLDPASPNADTEASTPQVRNRKKSVTLKESEETVPAPQTLDTVPQTSATSSSRSEAGSVDWQNAGCAPVPVQKKRAKLNEVAAAAKAADLKGEKVKGKAAPRSPPKAPSEHGSDLDDLEAGFESSIEPDTPRSLGSNEDSNNGDKNLKNTLLTESPPRPEKTISPPRARISIYLEKNCSLPLVLIAWLFLASYFVFRLLLFPTWLTMLTSDYIYIRACREQVRYHAMTHLTNPGAEELHNLFKTEDITDNVQDVLGSDLSTFWLSPAINDVLLTNLQTNTTCRTGFDHVALRYAKKQKESGFFPDGAVREGLGYLANMDYDEGGKPIFGSFPVIQHAMMDLEAVTMIKRSRREQGLNKGSSDGIVRPFKNAFRVFRAFATGIYDEQRGKRRKIRPDQNPNLQKRTTTQHGSDSKLGPVWNETLYGKQSRRKVGVTFFWSNVFRGFFRTWRGLGEALEESEAVPDSRRDVFPELLERHSFWKGDHDYLAWYLALYLPPLYESVASLLLKILPTSLAFLGVTHRNLNNSLSAFRADLETVIKNRGSLRHLAYPSFPASCPRDLRYWNKLDSLELGVYVMCTVFLLLLSTMWFAKIVRGCWKTTVKNCPCQGRKKSQKAKKE